MRNVINNIGVKHMADKIDIYKFILDQYTKHELSKQKTWDELTKEEQHYFTWEVCCKVNNDHYNNFDKFIIGEIIKEIDNSKIHITRESAIEIIKSFMNKYMLNIIIPETKIGEPVIYIHQPINVK